MVNSSDNRRKGRRPIDVRARMRADRELQAEISACLEHLADHLPNVPDDRLPRMLEAVLPFAWAEHVSFQRDALFPILRKRSAPREIEDLLDRLEREHLEISGRHSGVQEHIGNLLGGDPPCPQEFGQTLRGAFQLRRLHLQGEADLDHWVPGKLSPADLDRVDAWHASRIEPPFPLNVLFERG